MKTEESSRQETASKKGISRRAYTAAAAAILLSASMLRLIGLLDVPPGLARDETLNADIASFILNGRHAIFFREGFGHEPLYHYIGAAFQAAIGDNFLAIRLPSVFLSLILISVCIRWIRREFGVLVALSTGALMAVSWWSIIFGRVGLRPILAPTLLAAAALFWWKKPWLAGIFLGIATYSYTSASVMLLLPLFMVLYFAILRKRLPNYRRGIRANLIIFVVSVAIFIPLALAVRADANLTERVQQLNGPLDALMSGDPEPVITGFIATLGIFFVKGDPLWSYYIAGQPIFGLVTGLLLLIGLVICLIRLRQRAIYGFVGFWFFLTIIPSASASGAPSLIRIIGIMPIAYLLPSLGLVVVLGVITQRNWRGFLEDQTISSQLIGNEKTKRFVFIILIMWLTINLISTIQKGFNQWTQAAEVRQKYQSVWLDISRYLGPNNSEAVVVSDSWYEPVKADSLNRDFGSSLPARWIQQGNAVVISRGTDSLLFVPEFAPVDPLLLERAQLSTPVYRSPGFPSFSVYEFENTIPWVDESNEVDFALFDGGSPLISFDGYEIIDSPSSQTFRIVTYWEVINSLPWDLTAFVHIVDESDQLAAQDDRFDAAQLTLQPGDRLIQLHEVVIPEELSGYSMMLGLYTREDGRRLVNLKDGAEQLILLSSEENQ